MRILAICIFRTFTMHEIIHHPHAMHMQSAWSRIWSIQSRTAQFRMCTYTYLIRHISLRPARRATESYRYDGMDCKQVYVRTS